MSAPVGRWLLIAAGVAAAVAVTGAVATMGSPATQRLKRMDERRVRDLSQIRSAINAYLDEQDRLPRDLAALASRPGASLSIVDPQTSAVYGYVPGKGRSYRLCAAFATDTATSDPDGEWFETRWAHPKGEHCYALRGDPGRQ